MRVADRGHALRFLRVRGERLLAEHVLARFERGDRPFGVQTVRQRVVDRVDVRVGEQCRIRIVHRCDAVLRRERVGPAAIAGRNRNDFRFADVAGGFDHGGRRDTRRAENADANSIHARTVGVS